MRREFGIEWGSGWVGVEGEVCVQPQRRGWRGGGGKEQSAGDICNGTHPHQPAAGLLSALSGWRRRGEERDTAEEERRGESEDGRVQPLHHSLTLHESVAERRSDEGMLSGVDVTNGRVAGISSDTKQRVPRCQMDRERPAGECMSGQDDCY